MDFNSPDIKTFEIDLLNIVKSIEEFKTDSSAEIKIQSYLNITLYVSAVRFLEGSIKHIIYNNLKIKGVEKTELEEVRESLRNFNNPEFKNIKLIFFEYLDFNIILGLTDGKYNEIDITFLNQIVENRHNNVHSSEDNRLWYNSNRKDVEDFKKEYQGLKSILVYLDSLVWDDTQKEFRH